MAEDLLSLTKPITAEGNSFKDYLTLAENREIERVLSLTMMVEEGTNYYQAKITLWNSRLGEEIKSITLTSPGYYDLARLARAEITQLVQTPGGLTLFDWLILSLFILQIFVAWKLLRSQYFDNSPVNLIRSRLTIPTLGWKARRASIDPPPTLEGLGSAAYWRTNPPEHRSPKADKTNRVPTAKQALLKVKKRIQTRITDSGVFVELLIGFGGILMLFAWIFALNANMDYVRRFITLESSFRIGKTVADAQAEAILRFGPLLILNILAYLLPRVAPWIMPKVWAKHRTARSYYHAATDTWGQTSRLRRWAHQVMEAPLSSFTRMDNWLVKINRSYSSQVAGIRPLWIAVAGYRLPLTMLSALLFALSFPSETSLSGLPWVAWFALIPLFWVIKTSSFTQTIFYGTLFGAMQGILINYWHGTFGIIALPLSALAAAYGYFLFMIVLGGLRNLIYSPRVLGRHDWILLPLSWVVFDYIRSLGFAGYPWGYIGVSQYLYPRLSQIADLTGIWGISFLLLLFNAVAAHILLPYPTRKTPWADLPHIPITARRRLPGITLALLLIFTLIYGEIRLNQYAGESEQIILSQNPTPEQAQAIVDTAGAKNMNLFLAQQNTDPRKHTATETLSPLSSLSRNAPSNSILVWPEGAIPPVFQTREAPLQYLSPEFLPGKPLIAGVSTRPPTPHNASVFFSPTGSIISQYNKMKLVPFTEYVPPNSIWSRLTQFMLPFHPSFWTPGTDRTLHQVQDLEIATPICFEDTFPDHIRQFVLQGADLLLVLTNDYWSLTPVQAVQHTAHATFRSIETRTPMVRSTTSGMTGVVDVTGRVMQPTLPFYSQGTLLVSLPSRENTDATLYLQWGDWLPIAALIIFALICIIVLIVRTGEVLAGFRRYWVEFILPSDR
jgi:apolipoprotein N-acyltransferase